MSINVHLRKFAEGGLCFQLDARHTIISDGHDGSVKMTGVEDGPGL